MTDTDYHAPVGEGLSVLVDGLAPFVEGVLTPLLPAGVDWTAALRAKDEAAGRRIGTYSPRDSASGVEVRKPVWSSLPPTEIVTDGGATDPRSVPCSCGAFPRGSGGQCRCS